MGVEQKTWVVLINWSPRGPLTEEEIRVLLNQGVIRTNDVAYCIDLKGKHSDWRFLWQFQEFDRRLKQESKPVAEKRVPVPSPVHEERLSKEIPDELKDIRPEDLVPRARQEIQTDWAANRSAWTSEDGHDHERPSSGAIWDNPRLVGAAAGTLVIALLAGVFLGGGPSTESPVAATAKALSPSSNPTATSTGLPAQRNTASTKELPKPGAVQKRKPLPAVSPTLKPEAPIERGEISYEEYRKKRDEKAEKERIAEEKRRRLEEEGEGEDEEEVDSRPVTKKRKPAHQDPESDSVDEVIESEEDGPPSEEEE